MAAVASRRAAGLARATATVARVLWARLSACDADDYDDFGPDVVEAGEVLDGGAALCAAPGVAPATSAVTAGRGEGKLAVGRTASANVKGKKREEKKKKKDGGSADGPAKAFFDGSALRGASRDFDVGANWEQVRAVINEMVAAMAKLASESGAVVPQAVRCQAEEAFAVLCQAEEAQAVRCLAEEADVALRQAEEAHAVAAHAIRGQAEEALAVLCQAEEASAVRCQAEEANAVLCQAEEALAVRGQAEDAALCQAEEAPAARCQAEEVGTVLGQVDAALPAGCQAEEAARCQAEGAQAVRRQAKEAQAALAQAEEAIDASRLAMELRTRTADPDLQHHEVGGTRATRGRTR